MERRAHKLGRNLSGQFPRNWVFFDTETKETPIPGGKRLYLTLGVACYVRDAHGSKPSRESWRRFTTARQFWQWCILKSEAERRLVVLGYNVGFDMRAVDGFRVLIKECGYELTRIYLAGLVCIIEFTKGEHKILVLDACNFFSGTLERWGDLLGVKKVKVDFTTVSRTVLWQRCTCDTLILKTLWEQWRSFLSTNDFGHFCYTAPSQAMTIWRHRFMKEDVYIHTNARAIFLERQSYCGGRVECFRVGKVHGGPFWKVDVNSMYPFVMSNTPVPIKLIGVLRNPTEKRIAKHLRNRLCIADCTIKTTVPAYPHTLFDLLCWPVGTFRTVLSWPEYKHALDHGRVVKVHNMAIYECAILFDDYVRTLYGIRQKFNSEGNEVWGSMVKLLCNSLYGKFGQHSKRFEKIGYKPSVPDGMQTYWHLQTGEQYTIYAICGNIYRVGGAMESYNSFPAIASFITSSARMYLWQLIECAGKEHCFYCDTDSLIVDREGLRRLSMYMNPWELGKLKIEYKTQKLHIHSPKEYDTDTEHKRKGIRPEAKQVSSNTWIQEQWRSLRGSLGRGEHGFITIMNVTKTLTREYAKGVVQSDGGVLPLAFPLACAASN